MAPIHLAYTFDSDRIHDLLIKEIIRNGILDLQLLREQAVSIVQNASEETKHILATLGYDDEWLDDPEEDQSQTSPWYMIHLASVFEPCPSLSNNRFLGYYVLEKILPIAGWTRTEIIELIHGKRLASLLEKPTHKILLNAVVLLGGCLSQKDIETILFHLKSSASVFTSPSSKVKEVLNTLTDPNNPQPERLLSQAYQDAVDMLETALSRNHALYLIYDD